MNLLPVADYLHALNEGVKGETLFINSMPEDVVNGILLRPRLAGAQMDHYLPGFLKFPFQVIVRDRTYSAAYDRANQLAHIFRLDNVQMGPGWSVNYMRPVAVPVPFPRSPGDIVEVSFDVETCLVDQQWV